MCIRNLPLLSLSASPSTSIYSLFPTPPPTVPSLPISYSLLCTLISLSISLLLYLPILPQPSFSHKLYLLMTFPSLSLPGHPFPIVTLYIPS